MPQQSPPPSPSREAYYPLTNLRDTGSEDRTLPAPTTYDEFKKSKKMDHYTRTTRWIKPAGESGRKGFHPIHFTKISFKSTSRASLLCNLFWPVVPAAIAVRCKSRVP